MRVIIVSTAVAMALAAAVDARAEPRLPEKVQAALESWLAERAPVEKATGIAAYVSFGDPGPAIEAYFVYPEELRASKRISVFRDFLLRKVAETRLS